MLSVATLLAAAAVSGGVTAVCVRARDISCRFDSTLSQYYTHLEEQPELTEGVSREPSGRLAGQGLDNARMRLRADPVTQAAADAVAREAAAYARASAPTRWLVRKQVGLAPWTSYALTVLATAHPELQSTADTFAGLWPANARDPRAPKPILGSTVEPDSSSD